MTTPTEELAAVAIGAGLIVLLLVFGVLRIATAYRRTRATVRRWARTRLVVTQQARRRIKKGRR